MTEIRYRPGDWRAAVTPQGVALLPATMEADMLGRIWTSLQAGHGLGAVLESLTGAFGTSLRAIPPFAVVTFGAGEVRLAVRGPIEIDVVEADASYSVSGAEVTTWSERVVRNPTGLVVRTASAPGDGSYGVADGIVLCAELTVAFAPASSSPHSPPAKRHFPRENALVGAEGDVSPEVSAPGAPPEETIVPPEHTIAAGATPTSTPPSAPSPAPAATAAPAATPTSAPAPPPPAGSSGHVASHDAEDGTNRAPSTADEVVEYTQTELPDDAYDHLWGATVVKSVEHAAVRDVDEPEEAEEPVRVPGVAPTPPSEATPPEIADVDAAPVGAGFAPPADSASDADPWTAPPLTGLIDSVPGFGGVGASSSSAAWPDASSRDATPAARPTTADAPSTPAAGDDHDGLTVTVSELEAMRRLAAADAEAPPAADAGSGRMILSTGETHPLDRPVVIGRRPRANRVQADQVPLLVTVASPEQDISRNHLEVRIEGRHVLAADLDTTNGSVLHRDGTPPLRLAPNEPVLLLSGDVIDLGDGITVLFEDLP